MLTISFRHKEEKRPIVPESRPETGETDGEERATAASPTTAEQLLHRGLARRASDAGAKASQEQQRDLSKD